MSLDFYIISEEEEFGGCNVFFAKELAGLYTVAGPRVSCNERSEMCPNVPDRSH